MRVRTAALCVAAVPALALASIAYAGGRADPDYPQVSHSSQSRDAVADEAARANNGIHATEVMESQVQPSVSGMDRAQVQAEAIRANTGIHPTEVMESQVAPPVASANPQGSSVAHAMSE
ncbi:hypothetical protein ABL840_23860 [Variovorax sp. NFACC27]|uniref:hypothetical protein n=1 Tax=unclassified Variovorax TaxID=663243 RepID=UPI00089CAA26|nr:hypothetical protein [Variovorax paradoxus]SEF34076.1 hypothetical protein SAMN03159371_06897 [Variovorax sp. NFACC28]SEG81243.1 hypothetical protein SAMN03159365_04067 [Variovorax sp. NFACC29]SFD11703.1 hypothetical protein SAMN03159379_04185 [Variovorax sp. NFACC26]SFG16681.1 hypothetical protein SAMN03159447_02065 [Variovorax sp. NFACC27]